MSKATGIVGRSDSWDNEESKLKDAIALLERKQKLLDVYAQQQKLPSREALVLIITKNIKHAEEVQQILKKLSFSSRAKTRISPFLF